MVKLEKGWNPGPGKGCNIGKMASAIGKIITRELGLDGSDATIDGDPLRNTVLDDRESSAINGTEINIFGKKIQ